MPPTSLNPPNAPTPPPTYKQVATTEINKGKLITLAGQVGIDPATNQIVKGFDAQVKLAYENVKNCLAAVGATPRDIVHVRHYVVAVTGNAELDAKDIVDRGWGDVWIDFMKTNADDYLPPDAVLGVAALAKKDLLYEVECWAYVEA